MLTALAAILAAPVLLIGLLVLVVAGLFSASVPGLRPFVAREWSSFRECMWPVTHSVPVNSPTSARDEQA